MSRGSAGRASVLFVGIVLLVAAVGTGAYFASRAPRPKPSATVSPHKNGNTVKVRANPKVRIFVITMEGDDAFLTPETVTVKVGKGRDLHRAALEELIQTNRWEGASKNLIPQGTRLLGLKIEDGVAVANFSREFEDNFNGGSRLEALTVHSIVHTLTQFGDVKKVRFLIDGKQLDTLGGHLDVSEPVEADHTMLVE
jgi:germination protein M